MKRMIALYRDQSRASRAAATLEARGVERKHVSLLTSTGASGQLFMARYRTNSDCDSTDGETIGSTDVKLAGSLFASGAMFVGPIATSLATSGVKNLRDALAALGIPPTDLAVRAQDIGDGAVLLAVDVDSGVPDQRVLHEILGHADSLYLQPPRSPTNCM